MGLGRGMNVEPHSLLAATAQTQAQTQEEVPKYVPPARRGEVK